MTLKSNTIRSRILVLGMTILLSLLSPRTAVQSEEAVVRAVLFYSPSCPHCQQVVTIDLPPLIDKYGEGLLILGVNTYSEEGQELYQAAIEHFQIPSERLGVPTLIVGNTVLVGSYEIPGQFPNIIENGLINGGINWPEIPGLLELIEVENVDEPEGEVTQEVVDEQISEVHVADGQISENSSEQDTEEVKTIPEEGSSEINEPAALTVDEPSDIASSLEENILTIEQMTLSERFLQDRTGNTISVFILIGMVFSMFGVGMIILKPSQITFQWPRWLFFLLLVIGLVVAIYMAYVELFRIEAVCGPVGDCNTVQQSSYARLFGLLPVGVLGVLGYAAIIIGLVVQYNGPTAWRKPAAWLVWGMALFGTFFSIYLTFLEPFVIGATCAWCLTSAIVMTLLLWAATPPIMQILNGRKSTDESYKHI